VICVPDALMIYDADDAHIRFVWHGGEYIEYGVIPQPGEDFAPMEVLNVWDYEKGEPWLARNLDAFQKRCEAAVDDIIGTREGDE
jgi:hypothetical protein